VHLFLNQRSERQEFDMEITLDHIVLPSHDNEASARFFTDVIGLQYYGLDRHFAPVRVNSALTLDLVRSE
jgi:catechol-2,3-dioxygenase